MKQTEAGIYALQKWEVIRRTKKLRPFLRYVSVMDGKTTEKCRCLNDIIRAIDDPFWAIYYPCGECRCSVQQLSLRDIEKWGLRVTQDEELPNFVREQLKTQT